MKKLFRLISWLILAGLFMSGCQAGAAPAGAPQVATESGVTVIRVGTGDGGDGLTPHQQIIQNFEDKNPNILVQLEAVAGRDYYERLRLQLAANAAPDIMQIGDDAVPSFVAQGALVPIDDCIKKNKLDLTIYLPGLLDPGKINNKQYLLPKDYTPLGVYYNKKIFDAAGVAYPEKGWNWDDLLAAAQKLTRDENGDGTPEIWGIQLPATWTTGFEYWVGAAGGKLISEDGRKFVGYMDSPEVIRAMQFYADLYNQYKVAPPPVDVSQFGGGNTEFENGKAAMRLFGRWPQSGLLTNQNVSLGVVAPPEDKERANILLWAGFGVASTAKKPDLACKFLTYYSGEPGAQVWKDWALPAVTSVAESSGQMTDPIEGVWIGELNHLVPRAYTFTPYWNDTADPALRKALETVLLTPGVDVAATMKQAAQEAQAALDKLNK
jgi:multiple sugar transport system substrate-binding protein